ncbi:MAG: hypothetical protein HOP95_06340 [Sphingomonas sp.]|nr:hypothetical protein [Sphingomonas sp.]
MDIRSPVQASVLIISAAALIGGSAAAAHPQSPAAAAAEAKLDRLVDAAIDSHQFFTPKERAVIERACGYRPGEWNGIQVNMVGDTYFCTNGRQVSSPEVRAVMAEVSPRIDAYVASVMRRPDVVAAQRELDRAVDAEVDRRH